MKKKLKMTFAVSLLVPTMAVPSFVLLWAM